MGIGLLGVFGRLAGSSRLVGDPGIGDKPSFTGFRASVDSGALYFFTGVEVTPSRTGLSILDKRAVSDDASAVVRLGVNGAGLPVVVLRGVLYTEFVLLVVIVDVEIRIQSFNFSTVGERARSHERDLVSSNNA